MFTIIISSSINHTQIPIVVQLFLHVYYNVNSVGRIEDLQRCTLTSSAENDCVSTIHDLQALSSVLHQYSVYYSDRITNIVYNASEFNLHFPVLRSGDPGRPLFLISKSLIEALINRGFTYS